MSRLYEPFKHEAKRLVSIKCDRCEAELYTVSHQVGGTLRWSGTRNSQDGITVWSRGEYDLCVDCLTAAADLLVAFTTESALQRTTSECTCGAADRNSIVHKFSCALACAVLRPPTPEGDAESGR